MQNKAWVGLWFSTTLRHEYAIFSFEFIKVCLRNLREISAIHNMKSRPAIKFPTPYEWSSNALLPGQEKTSNARVGDLEASISLVPKFCSKQIQNFGQRNNLNGGLQTVDMG